MDTDRLKRTYEALYEFCAKWGEVTSYELSHILREKVETVEETLDKLADLGLVEDLGPVVIETYSVT